MASGHSSNKNCSSVELCCLNTTVQLAHSCSSISSSPSTCTLTLTILLKGSTTSPQAVEVRITDSSEPLLLLTSVVAAADYPTLRQSQGLLVDFSAFPQRLVELLQLCQQEQSSPQPKFVLVLSGAGPGLLAGTNVGSTGLAATFANSASGALVLEVVESNPFKRLSHLSLSVCSASTHDQLHYLASCINNLKNSSATDYNRLQSLYNTAQGELQQCREQLQQCKEESARQQQQSRAACDQLQQQHQQQLREEREKLLKERSDGDRRVSRVRAELEARACSQQHRLEALTVDNRAAAEHRAHAEAALREVRDRLSSAESSCSQLRAEQLQLRAGLAQAQEQLHGASSRGADLEKRLDESEHDRAEVRRSLQHTSHALDQARQKQSELEAALSASAAKCSKREASAAAVFMELQKSLQVIRTLQQREQLLQQQKDERDEALLTQQRASEGAEQRVTALEGRLEEAEQRLRSAREEAGEIEEQKRHLQDQLTESRERGRQQEKAVSWLQQRLEEAGVAAALVERVPLAGAYLRTQGAGVKTTTLIPAATNTRENGTMDSAAWRPNDVQRLSRRDSGGCGNSATKEETIGNSANKRKIDNSASGGSGNSATKEETIGNSANKGRVGSSALTTSTPLSAPAPPDRSAPLRQATLNSLSRVYTPGGEKGGTLPPTQEEDEDKENSVSDGLGPEYLIATIKDKSSKNKSTNNRGGGLTVRGLIRATGRSGTRKEDSGLSKGGHYNG